MEKHNQLPSRQPHSQSTYAKTNPKVLFSNPKNFFRVNPDPPEFYQEKPMTLNAWTQTTSDDFEYLVDEQQQRKQIVMQQNENELKLLEKIRVLEENLRVHSELLSQIHATSGGRFSQQHQSQSQQQQQESQQQQDAEQKQQQQQQHSQQQHQQQHSQQQQHHQPTQQPSRLSKHYQSFPPSEVRHKIASPSATSLINQFQQGPKESIKYTIIAEGGTNHENDEPIEIHLAEEDGALNLNSSADSGRLEIYIADENVDVKNEDLSGEAQRNQIEQMQQVQLPTPKSTSPPSSTSTPSSAHYMKRRKVDLDSSSPTMSINTSGNKSISFPLPIAPGPKINTPPNIVLPTMKKTLADSTKIGKYSPGEQSILRTSPDSVMVSLGPNNTLIPEEVFQSIPWKSASIATRRLLMTIFDRYTLATHSMTGKPSPAFKDQNKPLKKMLDRAKIEDILFAVTMKCGVSEKEVRNAITTKCADENKMMKLQMGKSHVLNVSNKENLG